MQDDHETFSGLGIKLKKQKTYQKYEKRQKNKR